MANTLLNYDSQGFIIGLTGIERQTQAVHDDTQEIIRILRSEVQNLRNQQNRQLRDINANTRSISRSNRLANSRTTSNASNATGGLSNSGSGGNSRTRTRITRHASEGRRNQDSDAGNTVSDNGNSRIRIGSNSSNHQPRTLIRNPRLNDNDSHQSAIDDNLIITPTPSTRGNRRSHRGRGGATDDQINTERQNRNQDRNRDERGRFTAQAEDDSFINRLSDAIGNNVGQQIDDRNLDPLIESFHEVRDMLSPFTSLFDFLTGGNEKPSSYERRRDRRTQNSLDDIEDALDTQNNTGGNSSGGGSLSSLLGGGRGILGRVLGGSGLLAGGAMGLAKLLGKRVPLLAGLLGTGSLAMNWDNLDTNGKGAGIGGVAGGVGGAMLGGAIGSFVGPVGTVIGATVGGWLGEKGGEVVGRTITPYVVKWTNNLSQANLPDKMLKAFTFGLNPLFGGMTAILPKINDWIANLTGVDIGAGFNNLWTDIKNWFREKIGLPPLPTANSSGMPNDVTAPSTPWTSGGHIGSGGDLLKKLSDKGLIRATAIDGGNAHAGTYAAALNMVDLFGGGVKGFGAFNDKFHLKRGGYHPKGLAFDMSVKSGKMYQATPEVAQIRQFLASKGFVEGKDFGILDEYLKPSKGATGGHIHFNWKSAEAAQRFYQAQATKTSGASPIQAAPNAPKGSGAYDNLIAASAARHGVDPALVKAMMHTESGFNPNARSSVGAQGLMQLMPATGRRFGVKNPFDPAQNIEGGVQYLKYLQKMFGGDMTKVIAAYNAGEGNVKKYGGVPPFKETQNYVKRVNKHYQSYQGKVSNLGTGTSLGFDKNGYLVGTAPKAATAKTVTPLPKPAQPQKVKAVPVTTKVSGQKQDLKVTNQNNQTMLPQNVSDRGIAHAITGGLGEERWVG